MKGDQIKRALTAFAQAGGLGIIPDDGEPWDDDLWNGMKAAIAIIRAETLEEAARVADERAGQDEGSSLMCEAIAFAIRALKEKP